MITQNPCTPKEFKTLIKKRDFFKGLLIGVCILWPCILAAAIYFYYKKGTVALFLPTVTIILGFLPVYLRVKTLNAEIKSKEIS